MPLVIFAAPWFSENAASYIEAILKLPDVRLAIISQDPREHLAVHLSTRLAAHWRVEDVLDSGQLTRTVRILSNHLGPIHRLLAVYEQLQVPAAETRESLGIEGMTVASAQNFRDKNRMKEVFRASGVPCARHSLARDESQVWRFAEEAGFPIVLKPPAGAGALSTFRVNGPDELKEALQISLPGPDNPLLLEEFITGDEHSFETVSIDGRPVWHSLTHYHPAPLEVLSNPWIQWSLVLPREIDWPIYDDIRRAAFQALEVLGMKTGLSHMEWFRRAHDGSVAISEVGARPPGAQITTLISRAHDVDFLLAWARLMVYGEFHPPQRLYAAGAAYLRGQGRGRVKAIHGLAEADHDLGHMVVDVKLPELGQFPTGSYEGEGYIILRHPETSVVKEALLRLISLIRVELG